MDVQEKRAFYRVPYRKIAGSEVTVVLENADCERFHAQILDLSIKGVGVYLEGDLPSLRRRASFIVEIKLSGYDQAIRLPATLRSALREPGRCRCGFEFKGGGFPGQGFASRVYGWFNRRRSPRAVLDDPVEVSFERVGFEPVKGRILDLGSNGATIDLSRGEGRTLRVGDTTPISLALSPDAPAASLLARIRSCELTSRRPMFRGWI